MIRHIPNLKSLLRLVPILGIAALWAVIFAVLLSVAAPSNARASETAARLNTNAAVLLIDMQYGFRPSERELREMWDRLVKEQVAFLKWAKAHDLPVLVVEYNGDGSTVPELKRVLKTFPDGRVVRIWKDNDDAFKDDLTREQILGVLEKWNVDHLIACGVNANACVKLSIYGAMRNQLRVSTSPDLVADFSRLFNKYPINPRVRPGLDESFTLFNEREEIESCESFLHNELPKALSGLPKNPFAHFLRRLWF